MFAAIKVFFASIASLFALFGRVVRAGDHMAKLMEEAAENLVDEQRIARISARRELLEDLGVSQLEFDAMALAEAQKYEEKRPKKAKALAITQ